MGTQLIFKTSPDVDGGTMGIVGEEPSSEIVTMSQETQTIKTLSLLICIVLCNFCFADETERPNIVLIITDDQNDYFSAASGVDAHTPSMDRLTKQAISFTHAYWRITSMRSVWSRPVFRPLSSSHRSVPQRSGTMAELTRVASD